MTYWFDDSLWYFILLLYGVDALFIGLLLLLLVLP